MKKLFLLIIILNLASASDNIIYKKEKKTNSAVNETLISIKKELISKINFFIPDYLQINPDKSFFSLSADYNSLYRKTTSTVSLHIKLPALKVVKFKQTKESNISKSIQYQYKLRPYIRLKNGQIKALLSNTFFIKQSSFFIYSFLDTFDYYPFDRYWDETAQFQIKKNKNTFDTVIKTDKNLYKNCSYLFGLYHSLLYNQKLFVIGYEISGVTDLKPFFYSYRLFLSYREKIFHSSRTYIEIKPYLFYSKSYDFHLKEALDININYKF